MEPITIFVVFWIDMDPIYISYVGLPGNALVKMGLDMSSRVEVICSYVYTYMFLEV